MTHFEFSANTESPQADEPADGPSHMHEEFYDFGRFNPLPTFDHPSFYETGTNIAGAVTVGPLDLTATQIKSWSEQISCDEISRLVQQGRLRPFTPSVINSAQYKAVLDAMALGQRPSANTIEQLFPGDLQRVIKSFIQQSGPNR